MMAIQNGRGATASAVRSQSDPHQMKPTHKKKPMTETGRMTLKVPENG